MAYFHTNVLDPQIKALPTVDTASGSVATFDTDMTENLIEVVCDIQYSQASGTPTPSNPLPITVYNSLNLSHSGADTSNPTVYNITFGQTVAKGTLNVTTGKLKITYMSIDMGDLNWSYISGQGWFQTSKPTGAKTPYTDLLCSCYLNNGTTTSQNLTIFQTGSYLRVNDSNYTDPIVFKTSVTGQKIVYELATPTTIQLSATQITALLNENNIWCDTNGNTSVKYILSVGKAIS